MLYIGICGLGLIGGSMAKAFSTAGYSVSAFDADENVVRRAISDGAAASCMTAGELSRQDIILVALYPDACVEYIMRSAGRIKPGAIVVDLCGVKGYVFGALSEIALKGGFSYIGGHPMAGIERSGYDFSYGELFRGASMILCPSAASSDADFECVATVMRDVGFARVTRSTPEHHDEVIAYTSQLAHIVSSAYVRTETALSYAGFSAGSFRDLTRVARLNPAMWTELFFENREPLEKELDELIIRLRDYSEALHSKDRQKMYSLLDEGNKIKIKSEEIR